MVSVLAHLRHKYVPPWELKPWPGESTERLQHRQDEQYFQEQVLDNVQWWDRFDYRCSFHGAKVLDLGCGHGALSISIAETGADEVIGLDLDARRVCFANEVLNERYPAFRNKVSFVVEDITRLTKPGYFDYVISKDSFEHIEGLDAVIAAAQRLLKPGGKIIVGFSPLYYSPFGDHGRLRLPRGLWLHALLSEQAALGWLSFRSGEKFHATSDIGLNKLTPSQFRSLFPQSTWTPVIVRYNRGSRKLLPVMSCLRRISWLERYFTVSIYAVFEVTGAGAV